MARLFIKSAWSFFPMAVMCAAFSGGWFQPTIVWSEAVLVKKSPAGPTIYLSSLNSDQFPSTQSDCAPMEFSCNNQPGPLPDALKSSFANELRTQGVIVVMKKPSHDIFDEVSVYLLIRNLPASPPIVPTRYVCNVMGMIIRHGTEGKRERKELERHNAATSDSASSVIRTCLQPAASLVQKSIKAMNQPQNKKDK